MTPSVISIPATFSMKTRSRLTTPATPIAEPTISTSTAVRISQTTMGLTFIEEVPCCQDCMADRPDVSRRGGARCCGLNGYPAPWGQGVQIGFWGANLYERSPQRAQVEADCPPGVGVDLEEVDEAATPGHCLYY
jgi:hypothetical protein